MKNRERQRANRRLKRKKDVPPPPCSTLHCNRNSNGFCVLLTDNDFGERPCPFFKAKEDAAERSMG